MGLFRDDGIENLDQVSFEVSDTISDQDLKVLEENVAAHATEMGSPALLAFTPLSILQHNHLGQMIAGLYGQTFWNWLYVDSLWVSQSLRRQGVGRSLMQAAENEAIRRGCVGAFLWTHTFDAPDFYPKLGYEKFTTFEGFPVGCQRFGFRKNLVGEKQ